MTSILIPGILNRIAASGAEGLELGSDAGVRREVETCRAWGYPIDVRDGRARLMPDQDSIVPIWVETETRPLAWERTSVRGFLEMGSTNEEALACARAGAPEGTLIYSEHQTAGRGRLGRSWYSPPRAGLYFTVLLRPQQSLASWPILTLTASISLYRALLDLNIQNLVPNALEIDLKWPNDVLLSGRKCAGILLETCHAVGRAEAAVVGVGVNIAPESIPPGHSEHATAVALEAGGPVPRRWLLVRFLDYFQQGYRLFTAGGHTEIVREWKERSTIWNEVPISVREGDQIRTAVTCGLTNSGALRIRTDGGREEILLAGDVAVRRR